MLLRYIHFILDNNECNCVDNFQTASCFISIDFIKGKCRLNPNFGSLHQFLVFLCLIACVILLIDCKILNLQNEFN